MRRLLVFLTALTLAALTLAAQTPDTQSLTATVRTMRRNSQASDDIKKQVDQLLSEAVPLQGAGQSGEVRRRMSHALALLNGHPWNQEQEFVCSLALRPERVVAEPSMPFLAHLTQSYPAAFKPANGLRLRGRTDHRLSWSVTLDVPSRDLIDQPITFSVPLDGIADGPYSLNVEVLDGDAVLATLEKPVQLVAGIDTQRAAVEQRLARMRKHEGAKASILYPYQLALAVNSGRRQWSQADFGIPWDPKQLPYDFAKGVRDSSQLLKSLESGKDPLWRAKGDHERHYWFEEASEPMAYRLYVPTRWDGQSKLPMVLVLHGNTRDQDYYFDRDNGTLGKLAEQHGFLVVAPMGYRPSAGWGSMSLRPSSDPARRRQSELSEQDALHVLDLVTKEYPVDPARTYLFGHSAGGAGTWYLGQKFPERWAAIAASAAATRPDGFPFERLKGLPVMVLHGDKDDEVPISSSRNMVKAMQEHGFDPLYVEIPGATHITAPAMGEPAVFDFFDKHRR
jgi:predicted esterase